MGIRMTAVLTSKGQITLPAALRRRLGVEAGDVVEFDDRTFSRASKINGQTHKHAVRSSAFNAIGMLSEYMPGVSSEQWIEECRGPVE